jgi:hypothetical protein
LFYVIAYLVSIVSRIALHSLESHTMVVWNESVEHREHAQTDARKGYELAILHSPPEDQREGTRPPGFVVSDSLVQRDRWAAAIKARSAVEHATGLRQAAYGQDMTFVTNPQEILKEKEETERSCRARGQGEAIKHPKRQTNVDAGWQEG